MKYLAVALLTIGALTVGITNTVVAGEAAPAADEIVIVDFETFGVDSEVMDDFYGHLRNILANEESTSISETGDVSIDELQLIAGCGSTEPDCLSSMEDYVDGNHLLFGSVEQSGDIHMFSLTLFDFDSGEVIRELDEKTLRGDAAWLEEGLPAVFEDLLYGESASVVVDVQGGPDADIQINGQSVGTGSATVDGVAPGEVVVTAVADDGTEEQERFILRHQEERHLEFELGPAIEDLDDPDDAGPSMAPGLALGGAGVAGAVLGMVGQIQLTSADAEAASLIDGRSAVQQDERDQLQQLQGDMTTANTMRWIGFGAGVAGLAGGGFLIYQALSADESAPADDGMTTQFDVGASSDGVNAGFRMQF